MKQNHIFRLRHPLIASAVITALSLPHMASAVDFDASTELQLVNAINSANGNGSEDTIHLNSSISLSGELPFIDSDLNIDGNNHTISGDGAHRIFFVKSGTVMMHDLTIDGGIAQGGDGGFPGGGGGAGMGGGLFVYDGDITLSNVHFQNNYAIGGYGGDAFNIIICEQFRGPAPIPCEAQLINPKYVNGGGGGGGLYGDGGEAGPRESDPVQAKAFIQDLDGGDGYSVGQEGGDPGFGGGGGGGGGSYIDGRIIGNSTRIISGYIYGGDGGDGADGSFYTNGGDGGLAYSNTDGDTGGFGGGGGGGAGGEYLPLPKATGGRQIIAYASGSEGGDGGFGGGGGGGGAYGEIDNFCVNGQELVTGTAIKRGSRIGPGDYRHCLPGFGGNGGFGGGGGAGGDFGFGIGIGQIFPFSLSFGGNGGFGGGGGANFYYGNATNGPVRQRTQVGDAFVYGHGGFGGGDAGYIDYGNNKYAYNAGAGGGGAGLGGGIFVRAGDITMFDVTFDNNHAIGGYGGFGFSGDILTTRGKRGLTSNNGDGEGIGGAIFLITQESIDAIENGNTQGLPQLLPRADACGVGFVDNQATTSNDDNFGVIDPLPGVGDVNDQCAAPVPTVSVAAQGLMGLLLAGFGWMGLRLRRRRKV